MRKIIIDSLKLVLPDMNESELTINTSFRGDLGLDSMNLIILLNHVCDIMNISMMDLDPSEISEIRTIGEFEKTMSKYK